MDVILMSESKVRKLTSFLHYCLTEADLKKNPILIKFQQIHISYSCDFFKWKGRRKSRADRTWIDSTVIFLPGMSHEPGNWDKLSMNRDI